MTRSIEESVRYAIFKKRNGRCQHCGTRLSWDEFGVRGRGGGWALEMLEEAPEEPADQGLALCFKCLDFPDRGKTGKVSVLSEP